jgi:ABC-type phosphate transport system substrate-binding protein
MGTIATTKRFESLRRLCVSSLMACALLWTSVLGLPAPKAAAASQELAIIAHTSAPTAALSAYEVEAIFTRSQTRWSDGTAVVPLNAPTGSETRTLFDRAVLRLEPDQVGRFWLDRRIRGLGLPPRNADQALALKVIANLKGAIGYVPSELAMQNVRVVARVRNGRVMAP